MDTGILAFHRARNQIPLICSSPNLILQTNMKTTLITLLALTGVAMGGEILTLSSDATNSGGEANSNYSVTDGKANLTNGNIMITWTEDYTKLSSWSLSFDLVDSGFKANPPNTTNSGNYSDSVAVLFGTELSSGGAGYLLAVTNTGALTLFTHKLDTTFNTWTSGAGWVTAGSDKTNAITLSYVANVADEYYGFYNKGEAAGTIVGGTFTISAGENSVSFDIDQDLTHTSLTSGSSNLWTNSGAEKMYNITVQKLDNKIIPEPATATLSLLALCGLAARRRRS